VFAGGDREGAEGLALYGGGDVPAAESSALHMADAG